MECYYRDVDQCKQCEVEVKYEVEKKWQEIELFELKVICLQFKVLCVQMNFYFMYNVLNFIQNYIIFYDVDLVMKYFVKFVQLMW